MPTQSGNVEAGRDIQARDIITGLKIDNLTIVFEQIDRLTRLSETSETRHRLRSDGCLEIVAGEEALLSLPPNLLAAFKRLPRAVDLSPEERHRAYAAWLVTRRPASPPQRVAARDHFVPLAGHTSWDWEEDPLQPEFSWLRPVGEGPERRIERERLPDVTTAVDRFPAFVLLGSPGSGKSTVLERLVYTAARDFLQGKNRRLPLGITLANYHWERELPLDFLRNAWAGRACDDFVDLARAGRLLLLADGLNEMPRLALPEDRSQRAAAWKRLLEEFFLEETPQGSRAIIASRDAEDYEQRLGLPRVEIEALKADQIERFVQAYLGDQTENFLAALDRLELTEQAGNPFSLFILTQLYDPDYRDLPANKGKLFARYAHGLLSVMYPFRDQELKAALLALARLGFEMQVEGEGTVWPVLDLQACLPDQVRLSRRAGPVSIPKEIVFNRAERAGLLSQVDEEQESYKFSHQLLQEQFAARHLLARWPGDEDLRNLWRVPRLAEEMPDSQSGEWDPLSPPPPTQWEQTTILAAGIIEPPDAFVRAVLAVHPALAGRCLSEGVANVSDETRRQVQAALLADLSDPALHRRTRIQAGRVLGAVGDPRFEPETINGVAVIVPEFLDVPGGEATLGSDEAEADDDEQPVHRVKVAAFQIARYPVTNAEYRCFIEAGGYDTERYWTAAGWQWRHGQAETSGPVDQIMETRRSLLENPGRLEQGVTEGWLMPQEADKWRDLIELTDEAALERVSGWFPVESHEQPSFWEDPAYNAPNQPVVGVTWYEAMAYCAWLNETLGAGDTLPDLPAGSEWIIRLPVEAEWEWAAGGPAHSRYPWGGKFEPDKANTLEGRVLGTTPVGAYPGGAAPCGALDMAGNVYEWQHTLYRPYPYRADDGRENSQSEGRRTLRGGSWLNLLRNARVSSRNHTHPDVFDNLYGLRLVVAPV